MPLRFQAWTTGRASPAASVPPGEGMARREVTARGQEVL